MKTQEEIILLRDAFLWDGIRNEHKDAYSSYCVAQALNYILDDPELKPSIKESIEESLKTFKKFQEG